MEKTYTWIECKQKVKATCQAGPFIWRKHIFVCSVIKRSKQHVQLIDLYGENIYLYIVKSKGQTTSQVGRSIWRKKKLV